MLRKLTGSILLLLLFAGCGKERSNIPNVAVNFNWPLSDPRLLRLSSPGGAVTIEGYGIAGLVLYRTLDGRYVAYDRCSTVNPQKLCAVVLDDPSFTVTDKCSGGKFSLEDGSPDRKSVV